MAQPVCPACGGNGKADKKTACEPCGGSGEQGTSKKQNAVKDPGVYVGKPKERCSACSGYGRNGRRICQPCNGSGQANPTDVSNVENVAPPVVVAKPKRVRKSAKKADKK